MLVALSTAAWTTIGGVAVAVVTTAGAVFVARINRQRDDQDEETTQSVTDFAKAYRERGDIIEGYRADHGALVGMISDLRKDHETLIANLRDEHAKRIALVEEREQNCLDALEFAHQRIAVLESRSNGHDGT